MANMRQVNKAVSEIFPDLDVQVVRGSGYFYFCGNDGFGVIDSVMCHPSTTSTDEAISMAVDAIRSAHEC